MINKKGQTGDWEEIIKFILIFPILLVLLGAILGVISQINKQNCPVCEDCTPYKNNLTNLSKELELCKNQSKEIVYVNQTIEVPVYKDTPFSIIIIFFSWVLSMVLTIGLFRIKVKLPKEIEEKIKYYDKWIIIFKWISLAVMILIFIKLVLILVLIYGI